MRIFIATVFLGVFLIAIAFTGSADRFTSGGLSSRVAELEAQVEELAAILRFVRVEEGRMDLLTGPHWIIEGANVHVRSGSSNTSDDCEGTDPDYPNCESLTGLGNLIVGYNERIPSGIPSNEHRTGSHNLVVGDFHTYTSFGGFVAGGDNRITGEYASVSGGANNIASGSGSSILGGNLNRAIGDFSTASGGLRNVASGVRSSVSGGDSRSAPDDLNWAAGSLLEPN